MKRIIGIFLNACLVVNLHCVSYEQQIISNASQYCKLPANLTQELYNLACPADTSRTILPGTKKPELFTYFPNLAKSISYISLGDFPTPVTKADNLAQVIGIKHLYIKRDDLSGKKIDDHTRLFGGNKVRKLEFLLADALSHNARTIITFGCAGSNHALATSTYASYLGLNSISLLRSQWNSHIVQRNLLLGLLNNTTFRLSPTAELHKINFISELVKHKQKYGDFPYVIPVGGSCPLGVIGFINAVFELKKQIEQGIMQTPDKIYVPVGSCGTFVGLLLGIKAAQLHTQLIGVTIEPEEHAHEFVDKILELYQETNTLLYEHDTTFGLMPITARDIYLTHDACGQDYALFTPEAVEAMKLMQKTEAITLDGVYTGKACAGMLKHLQTNPLLDNQIILFWHTFCSDKFENKFNYENYHKLPKAFQTYFQTAVQPLDTY